MNSYLYFSFFVSLFFFYPVLYRLISWLGLWQQKEYRLDRISAYLKTKEGRLELMVPLKTDFFTPQLVRRPKLTFRSLALTSGTLFQFLVLAGLGWWWGLSVDNMLIFSFWIIVLWLLIPLIILLANWPWALAVEVYTWAILFFAQQKIARVRPVIIGVTGSYGKTSTKFLIAEVLRKKYRVFSPPKSFNTALSVGTNIVESYLGEEIMVIEYAAYTMGEIKRLAKFIKPCMAVITGIAPQHLELFGSEKNIVKAKSELVKALADKTLVWVNKRSAKSNQIAVNGGASNPNYFDFDGVNRLKYLDMDALGRLKIKIGLIAVETNLVGKQLLEPLAAAVELGKKFKLSDEEIAQAIKNFKPNERFVNVRKWSSTIIIDDGYSTNPIGFEAGMRLAGDLKKKQNINETILMTSGIVDLGKLTDEVHFNLGRLARQIFDQVAYFGQTGREAFARGFGKDLVSADRVQLLTNERATIILIEGRLPKRIEMELKAK